MSLLSANPKRVMIKYCLDAKWMKATKLHMRPDFVSVEMQLAVFRGTVPAVSKERFACVC